MPITTTWLVIIIIHVSDTRLRVISSRYLKVDMLIFYRCRQCKTYFAKAIKETIGILQLPSELTWWRHQMETYSASLAFCAGNSPVPGEFPAQRPVTRSFDVFFDPRLNKRLSKQSWDWWFETLSCPLWRHCNDATMNPRHRTFKKKSSVTCDVYKNETSRSFKIGGVMWKMRAIIIWV